MRNRFDKITHFNVCTFNGYSIFLQNLKLLVSSGIVSPVNKAVSKPLLMDQNNFCARPRLTVLPFTF